MKIFLGFAFRDQDKDLVNHVDRLLASQGIQPLTGEALGGEQLNPAVQQRIDEADGTVGLLTRREKKKAGGWITHQWVADEVAYARARHKHAIALVEKGVDVNGMYQPHEHIPFDRAAPLPAIVRLAETVGQWRRAHGRTVKVQILPQSLAARIGRGDNNATCRYRLCLQGHYTAWTDATLVPETGGTFVWISGVQEDQLVQIEVREGKKVWLSDATSQWLSVTLPGGGKKR